MAMVRYPLPITNAMLTPANPRFDYPRYSNAADWYQGVGGNEEDVATATTQIVSKAGTGVDPVAYTPRTQSAKAAAMVPPLQIVDDLGIDYGAYKGQAGRTGFVTPLAPYPDVTSPPQVTSLSPNTGLAAGGTAVTVTGSGFTGATAVSFGGTNATAVVVVNPSTITCNSPAKAVGTYDVVVTTPKGTSPIGGALDNFVYT